MLALVGCVSQGGMERAASTRSAGSERPADEQGLHLRLIAQLLEDGKPHAALAHLESIDPEQAQDPRARLLRAEVLRRLTRFKEAYAVYETLLHGPLAAHAWRGLALMKAASGEMVLAREWLRHASSLNPTDARIRNDLGYALLLVGELEQASSELATAIELGDTERAPRNLVLLLMVQGDQAAAERVAARHLEPELIPQMRDWATALRLRLDEGGGA